jgi:hypothetical protein
MFYQDLLPQNATAFERALSNTVDLSPEFKPKLAEMPEHWHRRPIQEDWRETYFATFGLDLLRPFVQEEELIIAHWREFFRLRGTPRAVHLGIDLTGYDGALEEAPAYRSQWNVFQYGLYRVRDRETPDLANIAGMAALGAPERSKFVRGYSGHDYRALESSYGRWGETIYSDHSGARLAVGGPQWSFGRFYEHTYDLVQADLTALGLWIAPSAAPFTWETFQYPWTYANFPSATTVNSVRRQIMARALSEKTCWAEFRRSDNTVIGLRRCHAVHAVVPDANGYYVVNSAKYARGYGTDIYVESLTGFGEGDGEVATSVVLRFGASPADTTKPGLDWGVPSDVTTPFPAVAANPVNVPFGKTVRERFKTLLRVI